MDEVDCPECGHRYDSDDNPFCPRCGSLGKPSVDKPDAVAVARQDPTRRRVQAAGIILLVLGSLSAVLYTTVAIAAGSLVPAFADELLADQPGGLLEVTVEDGGAAVAGAWVNASVDGDVFVSMQTDANGTATLSMAAHAAANVTITADGQVFERRALSLDGQTTRLSIDVQTSEPVDDSWAGASPLVTTMRVLLGFFIAMSAFVAFSGVAALRLRWRGIAMAGGLFAAIPALIVFVAVNNIGTMLLLALSVAAFVMIAMGRRHFS